jgi:glycosyltransferase involved in cell wall biosynthesis
MHSETADVSLLEAGSGAPRAAAAGVPSVSVIMPNYNHGKWLARSLGALVAQTGPSKEIVLIDDGSTDNSAEIIAGFCRRHDCIRLVRHDVNRGYFAAIESGIGAARGEFVLFAAADDFVLEGLLARAEAALRAHPAAAFYCAEGALVDRAGNMVGYRPIVPPRFTSGYLTPADVRRGIRRSDNWFFGPSVIYRRGLLAHIGFFDKSLGTLSDGMAARLLGFQHGFYFDAKVLAVWMIDPESLSAQTSLSAAESRRVVEDGARWISAHFPADIRDSYRAAFERRLRFNMARHRLLWRSGASGVSQVDGVCDVLNAGFYGRLLIRFLYRVPLIGPTLVLAAMTLLMRPMSMTALVKSWWRVHVVQRGERTALERRLAPSCNANVVERAA